MASVSPVKAPQCSNVFSEPNKDSDVIFKVENCTLYLHSWLLSHYSPVFKAMFTENFKEGLSKEIELKGKNCEHIIEFLKYFYSEYFPGVQKTTDFKHLLALCEEYQVDWLKTKFEDFLLNQKANMNDEEIIKYLCLSERYKLDALKGLLSEYYFRQPLSTLSKYWGYDELSNESKYQIMRKRLVFNLTQNKASFNTYGQPINPNNIYLDTECTELLELIDRKFTR